jgi:hypothetical protein
MRTMWKAVLAAGLVSAVAAQAPNEEVLRAQKKLEAAADQLKANVMFNQQTFQFVAGQLISGPPVKGAPYSAEAVNETIQTLADGNRIVQRTSAMQYRDSDGRERREETSAMGAIFINDPVTGVRYTLHPDSRTAEKGALVINYKSNGPGNAFFYVNSGVVTALPGGRGPAPDAGVIVEHTQAGLGRGVVVTGVQVGGRAGAVSESAKTEQLGKMYIEGVQADGTRTTNTIPAGDIGNERPINIVDERWYSPDLQMTVMTKHSDPRTGETNFQLKNINRSSPPPNLFEVPSDYTVTGGGGGRGGRGAVALPADALQKVQELQKAREEELRQRK